MIHRRLLKDDGRGVGEPLNETENNGTIGLTQKMKHYLLFGDLSNDQSRTLQYILDTAPIIVFANDTLPEFLRNPSLQETSLNLNSFSIEKNLKIYLKELSENDTYLLRVMNNDDKESKKFSLNYEYKEMSLTASITKEEMEKNKLKWMEEKDNSVNNEIPIIQKIFPKTAQEDIGF